MTLYLVLDVNTLVSLIIQQGQSGEPGPKGQVRGTEAALRIFVVSFIKILIKIRIIYTISTISQM